RPHARTHGRLQHLRAVTLSPANTHSRGRLANARRTPCPATNSRTARSLRYLRRPTAKWVHRSRPTRSTTTTRLPSGCDAAAPEARAPNRGAPHRGRPEPHIRPCFSSAFGYLAGTPGRHLPLPRARTCQIAVEFRWQPI